MNTNPERQERINQLQKQIDHINETIYPDNFEEVVNTMLGALEDRIDDISEGRA